MRGRRCRRWNLRPSSAAAPISCWQRRRNCGRKGRAPSSRSCFPTDAVVASQEIAGISDRGLRRLFDRLLERGAVRELSGRPTFRIYGL
ncbi:DUF1403 family protein [Mesorhizobium shangrilense]|uniref:DUF1403 family protein n=1 Tax=Mesorhizobium shangrilense TaxID=460060 RepID=A0ABV2DRY4_9HYPH